VVIVSLDFGFSILDFGLPDEEAGEIEFTVII
jgi:hypothetical protein